MFEIILINTVIIVFGYHLVLLSKLKSKVVARNTALDACNQKLDKCLESLKEATKYYEDLIR